ncbi:MAG: hypothetical protein ACPGVD_10160, partial [Flavobacteriales bacterium]
NFTKIKLSDSIVFSSVGYSSFTVEYAKIHSSNKIFLVPKAERIRAIQIKAEKYKYRKRARLGRKKASRSWGGTGLGKDSNSRQQKEAKFIPNDIGAEGIIDEIRVFVRFGSKYPFEVDVLGVNELTGAPSSSLLQEPIKVVQKKNKKWTTIKFKKQKINIPKSGFFIAINWNGDSIGLPPLAYYTYNVHYVTEDIHRVDTFFYRGTVIASNFEKEPNWWLYSKSKWRNYWQLRINYRDTCSNCFIDNPSEKNYNQRNSRKQTLAVYANILYSKSAKKYVENILDKEGVVSKDDQKTLLSKTTPYIEKDKLLYPQKDVFQLFESIKRALKSNQLNYISHHLLYYDYRSIEGFEITLNKSDRGKIIYDIEEILANREKIILKKLDNGFYEFSFDDGRIQGKLLLQNGKWRLGVEDGKETRY